MDDLNDNQGEVVYEGKLKTQNFKQLQLEKLLKSGAVVLESKLAETKELELQRVRDFEAAATDEGYHRKAAKYAPYEGTKRIPLTIERFEE